LLAVKKRWEISNYKHADYLLSLYLQYVIKAAKCFEQT
jgi:hypothetical protein